MIMSVNKFPNTTCNNCGKKNKKVTKALLTCNHAICHNCIDNIMRHNFGNELAIVSIDKKRIFDPTCDKEYSKMILGTKDTSGIIQCPKCKESYSIIHALFREHGLPMKINGIVEFEHEENIITHHLCTSLDLIHLMNREKQTELLDNFDYDGTDHFDHLAIPEIKNYDVTCSHYHVVNTENSYEIQNRDTCEACAGNGTHTKFDEYLSKLHST